MSEKYPSYVQLQKALRLACGNVAKTFNTCPDEENFIECGLEHCTCDVAACWERYFLTEVEK